ASAEMSAPLSPFEPMVTREWLPGSIVPVSGATLLLSPVPLLERYWSDMPSSSIAASVGLYSSTNFCWYAWFADPPRPKYSLMTTWLSSGAANAAGAAIGTRIGDSATAATAPNPTPRLMDLGRSVT